MVEDTSRSQPARPRSRNWPHVAGGPGENRLIAVASDAGNLNFSAAVPALVNCRRPADECPCAVGRGRIAKFTSPRRHSRGPKLSRVAVSVTTLPEATEVTGEPAEVTASVVVVGCGRPKKPGCARERLRL